uniref:DUF3086 domain-containing protein n=1 Tax=Paulinella chromatophora TaxID=39717 RepID=B1X3J3_PAUCH|nr:hypothetical protein PCC_0053 [Paulinella chromatophora]ACB42512.1 hypothetical protein PCC_0053 [Paulinella chromatophora]
MNEILRESDLDFVNPSDRDLQRTNNIDQNTSEPSHINKNQPPFPISSNLLFDLALKELRERRDYLKAEIQKLEQRHERLQKTSKNSSLGKSEEIARQLKGFQSYLVGALQDLSNSAEQIDLVNQPLTLQPSLLDKELNSNQALTIKKSKNANTDVTGVGAFAAEELIIRARLEKFTNQPELYTDPWKLRRSLDKSYISLIEDWFLNQGGRGAQISKGSRNHDILTTAAAIAILGELYGDQFQALVLAGRPKELGEWRRGLQDCLGLTRKDFGLNSGIMLFEREDILIERADRLEKQGELPFIVIDIAQRVINVSILQFPLLLAFIPENI